MEGTCGNHLLSCPSLEQGQLKQLPQDCAHLAFDQPLSLETPQPFLAASSSVCSYNTQVFFSHVETEFIVFQFVAIASCSVAGCDTAESFRFLSA